jgi:hypothetical protein
MSGTFVTTVRPLASRAAAISFSALFLAPPTYAVPRRGWESGPWDRTWKPCTGPMLEQGRSVPLGSAGQHPLLTAASPARSPRPQVPDVESGYMTCLRPRAWLRPMPWVISCIMTEPQVIGR